MVRPPMVRGPGRHKCGLRCRTPAAPRRAMRWATAVLDHRGGEPHPHAVHAPGGRPGRGTARLAIAVETHGEYTATPERLDRHRGLIEGPALTIHLDTGNSYLSGNDPHAWLETIVGRATHPPTKDISHEEAARYLAKFRGTLGCACGEGVIAWERIVSTLATADHDVVHFVKCASLEAATKS
ncbi:hypothetical protein [Streptomyces antimycoticus]|uniref:hypothetical protein n=2 Tax=Streptomyces antimycoticus TaxID=68175 RepID=UPI0036957744